MKVVLFDLDGTFADTAPDLAYAVNQMREQRGLPPMPLSATRPVTSLGARGLLNVAFGLAPDHPEYGAMRLEFLRIYESNICRESRLFPGVPELLAGIEARALRWGIVTNKAERLARLLMEELSMTSRAACIIGGDSTAHTKPHPAPLLEACRVIGEDARECVYVGDDRRDIEAGRAAGMQVAVALWGYLNGGAPETWAADCLLEHPQALMPRLGGVTS